MKRLQIDSKYAIFKNWPDTHLKMETHDPNVYPTILGGVSRGFWTPFLNRVARSTIFWHLKTGTFGKSARFQVPKNGTSSAQIFKRTPKTSRNTPQNGGVDIWFMRFHFWASIKHILKNRIFSVVLGLFYPLNEPKTKSVVQSAKYRVIGLKICMQAHFMVVQALLE